MKIFRPLNFSKQAATFLVIALTFASPTLMYPLANAQKSMTVTTQGNDEVGDDPIPREELTPTPRVTITEFTLNPETTVGEPTEVKLKAELEGVTPDGEVTWLWFDPQLRFNKDEPKDDRDWNSTTASAGSANVYIANKNSDSSTQPWEFKNEGYYEVYVIVSADFTVNGVPTTLYSVGSNQGE